jgi:hypothetical protein
MCKNNTSRYGKTGSNYSAVIYFRKSDPFNSNLIILSLVLLVAAMASKE